MTVRLEDMTWPEVKEALTRPHAIIIPLGSTEEHGYHLPLKTDSLHATHIAEHAAQRVLDEHNIRAMVAPTLDYTDVSMHKMFPGTIGLKVDTLIRVIIDILEGFLDQGFKNVFILNGHLHNNCCMEAAVRTVAYQRPEAKLYALCAVMGLGSHVLPGLVKAGTAGKGHALEVETSDVLFMEPESVHLDRAVKGSRKLPLAEKYVGDAGEDTRHGVIYYTGITGNEETGIHGDPTMASRETGAKLVNAIVDDLVGIIVQAVKTGS